MRTKHFYFFFLLLFLSACIPFKYSKSPDFDKYFTEFLISDSVTQVFIRPLTLKGKKNEIEMDFTFRNNCRDTSRTKANFSFISAEAQMESIAFYNNDSLINIYPLKLMYKERRDKEFLFRYSAAVPNIDFYHVYNDGSISVNLINAEDTVALSLSNKSQRIVSRTYLTVLDYLPCTKSIK